MKCRVLKGKVDGVSAGGEVEVADNLATRGMIAAGELEPLHPIPEAPPPKAFKPASKSDLSAAEDMRRRFESSWGEAQQRIRALEAENADLRAQIDAVRHAAAGEAHEAAEAKAEGKASKTKTAKGEG